MSCGENLISMSNSHVVKMKALAQRLGKAGFCDYGKQ